MFEVECCQEVAYWVSVVMSAWRCCWLFLRAEERDLEDGTTDVQGHGGLGRVFSVGLFARELNVGFCAANGVSLITWEGCLNLRMEILPASSP